MSRADFYPSPVQELLLKAALLDGPKAIACWDAWRSAVVVDDIDIGSQRLLPLLYRNLQRLGIDHPDLNRYRSVHRYIWVDNQLRIRQAVALMETMDAANIPVVLLKGIALATLCYEDIGQRPMSDLDFLVSDADVQAAGQLLEQRGWHSPDIAMLASDEFRSVYNALTFSRHGTLTEVDLHWHSAHELWGADANADLYARAQTMEIGGIRALTLSDTDHLFLTCIHGTRSNEIAPIRWIADAILLIRRRKIDWSQLSVQIRKGLSSRRLGAAFRYLEDEFEAGVPASFFAELAQSSFSKVELLEDFVARRKPPEVIAVLGTFCAVFWRNPYYRSTPAGFLSFMRARWGARSMREIFSQGLQRTAKHIFKSG
jgi:hypothetical protein